MRELTDEMQEVCKQILKELDHRKLLKLTKRLNQLFEEREQKLQTGWQLTSNSTRIS